MAELFRKTLNRASTRRRYGLVHARRSTAMIDNLALAISHGLMALAVLALLRRPDLDREPGPRDTPAKRGDRPGA